MVKIFAVHSSHCILKNGVPNRDFIVKVNLNSLPKCKYSENCLAENRFLYYLATRHELINEEYIGILSGRYKYKYPKSCMMQHLHLLSYKRDEILVPCPTEDWYSHSERSHPGMRHLVDELCERNMFKKEGSSFYSNNFICHRDVMIDFLRWWLENFEYFYGKYDNKFSFGSTYELYQKNLHPSYFYERLTVAYFANSGLKVRQIPSADRHTKLL